MKKTIKILDRPLLGDDEQKKLAKKNIVEFFKKYMVHLKDEDRFKYDDLIAQCIEVLEEEYP
jgi:transcription elongation factor GreA-like protein